MSLVNLFSHQARRNGSSGLTLREVADAEIASLAGPCCIISDVISIEKEIDGLDISMKSLASAGPKQHQVSNSSETKFENPPFLPEDINISMPRQLHQLPVTPERLVTLARSIYASLLSMESKCIETHNTPFSKEGVSVLSQDELQSCIILHRSLLGEHYDFFLVTQHPLASASLRRLPFKYGMPARMWQYGIFSLLERMRQQLPDCLEYLLAYLNMAYNMMTLFYETVPILEDVWAECLGDLARYGMGVGERVHGDVWVNIAQRWYAKLLRKSPTTGRLYHHLAVVEQRNAVEQLFYFIKSLCVADPFPVGTRSTTRLFAFSAQTEQSLSGVKSIEAAFVKIQGIIWFGKTQDGLQECMNYFVDSLCDYINEFQASWITSGHFIGATLPCALLKPKTRSNTGPEASSCTGATGTIGAADASYSLPEEMVRHSLDFMVRAFKTALYQCANFNTLPFLHTMFVFIAHAAKDQTLMSAIEEMVPWRLVVVMLSHLFVCVRVVEADYEVSDNFPTHLRRRPLPEDFAMRGLPYADDYFPSELFDDIRVDEEEKMPERPWMATSRMERILSLGCGIARSGNWILWDAETRQFLVYEKYYDSS